jgi:hypothetical protein
MCATSHPHVLSLQGHGMKTETFICRTRIDASAAEVYAWHALPGALELLTPPGEHVKVIEKTGGIERGARMVLQFGRWPMRRRWVAEHQEYKEGRFPTCKFQVRLRIGSTRTRLSRTGPSPVIWKIAWNMLCRSAFWGDGLQAVMCGESSRSYLNFGTQLRHAR